ncbi:hypothetical protein LX16_0395 [Stackebrandtia albiflava]|uniref:YbaB/EbfC DNA-binding family protein n=1 Tax=Stackebrandtia albiflava TaxID=406432 RepID=A0A562V9Z9_9ACTN|nr:YbaB/EbfC family nucleoid-associated protein [Stackebrandtia albiflava]TWJ14706.1 hypothetical protein LX16_0395 [Stackebrandtia albiflava]
MGQLGRHLNEMTIRAVSPDRRIRVLIRGRGQPTVSFADPEAFADYRDAETLASEVSAALDRASQGLEEGRRKVVDRFARQPWSMGEHWNGDMRRMYQEINDNPVEGFSGANVRVATRGLKRWRVRIRPGALQTLTAQKFLSEVNIAIRLANQQYFSTMRRVKSKTLGGTTPVLR